MEFVLNHPDRCFGGVLISGMSEVREGYLKRKISLGMSVAKRRAVPILATSISWTNSNSRKVFMKLLKEAMRGNARNIEEYYRYSKDYNCTQQLDQIKLPMLLVFGEKDKLFYEHAKLLHEKLPSSELSFINRVKHHVPTKAAVELNERIRQFVNEVGTIE